MGESEMGDLFYRFGIALAIGLLIGMEREFAHSGKKDDGSFAGMRTFPLFALIGCAGAMIGDLIGSPWGFVAPLVIIGGLIAIAYAQSSRQGYMGLTTEATAVLTVMVGALVYHDQRELAAALAVTMMFLLSFKIQIQDFVKGLTRDDIIAVVKLGIITAVVLPLLPDQGIGPAPFDVVNPHNVWLMVILVSGLGFIGYALMKIVGPGKGITLTGFLGGLVSSTAVTLAFSQKSNEPGAMPGGFAVAIVVAWVTMFVRVVVEVAVVNQALVATVWIPMIAAAVAGIIYCVVASKREEKSESSGSVDTANPFSLKKSLTFGALYAVILVVARVAEMYLGTGGIYASAVVAGFTDVDAITLSMAELSQENGSIDTAVATRAITLAAMSNTLVKAGMVFTTGSALLKKAIWPAVVMILVAGLAGAFLQ